MEPKVAIIMGSKSDFEKVKPVVDTLDKFEVPYTLNIYSAHRTLKELCDFVTQKIDSKSSYQVVIACAGMAAALAGVVAAETVKPVIGLPLSGGKYNGFEAMLATCEMPPGNPVLTVGIDAAKNAALAAARIVALSDSDLAERLSKFRISQAKDVQAADYKLQNEICTVIRNNAFPEYPYFCK